MAKPEKKYECLSNEQKNFLKKALGIRKLEDLDLSILKELKERLKALKDTRNKNMLIYKLWDVIMCVVIASFANNNTWKDIHQFVVDNYKWFKSFLQMTGGIPCVESYERIISLVDSNELNEILLDFFSYIIITKSIKTSMYNFDGRVNNGSKRKATILSEEKRPLNCLNVYSNELGYCIKTVQIDEKTNEIPTIKDLVKGMDLTGVVVTWDALNTQTENVKVVIDAHGDYTVPVKGNQGNFNNELDLYFDQKKCEEIKAGNLSSQYMTYNEKSHSAIVVYECFQTSDIDWFADKDKWIGLKTIGMIKKSVTTKIIEKKKDKKGKYKKIEKIVTNVECRYYISSRQVDIKEFNKVTRKHWNVENKVHFHLDFTFCQDSNKTTNKKALLNLEIIHKFVLAILEKVKPIYKNKSLKDIRKHLSNNFGVYFPEFLCYLALQNPSVF